MIPADLSLDAPHALWLLLFLLLFLIGFISLWRYRKKWSTTFNPQITHLRPWGLTIGQWMALSIAWIAAVFAFTQPKGNARYPEELVKTKSVYARGEIQRPAQEILLFVDTSASMGVKDSRTGRSRLDAAIDIADQIAARVKGEELGLYAFTYDVTTLSPPTLDSLYVRLMLRDLHINEGDTAGTSLLNALKEFQKRYLQNPSVKDLTLVLLSDGGDNQIESVEGEAKQKLQEELLNTLKGNNASRLHVYTIGLGSQEGGTVPSIEYQGKPVTSRLDSTLLRMLASQGKGSYFAEQSQASVNIVKDLFEQIEDVRSQQVNSKIAELPIPIGSTPTYDLYFQLPLALSLMLLSWALFAPETWRKMLLIPLALIPWIAEGSAFDEAAQELEVGRPERAIALYEGLLSSKLPDWQRAIITYNLGTAYLEAGQPTKALQSYETVVWKKNPFPLLQRRLRTNRAIAYYRLALQEPREQVESDEQALEYLLEAGELVGPAIDADCAVQKSKGAKVCSAPEDLLLLKKRIQSLREEIFAQYLQQRPQDLEVASSHEQEIQRLLRLYRFALVSDPPDQNTLQNLSEGQARLLSNALPSEKAALESAQEALLSAQNQKAPFAIRFELERGRYALSQLLVQPVNSATSLLEQTIAQQLHALTLNRLLMRMGSSPPELKDEVMHAQDSSLKMANEFLPLSYQEQLKQFNNPSLNADMRCQVQPWGAVYPLFFEGLQKAEKAVQGQTMNLANQTAATVAWRKALQLLQNSKKNHPSGCPGGTTSAPKEAVQNIIEMDKDDRLPPEKPAIQLEGVKPW